MNDHIYIGQPISQTVYWSGTDTEERYRNNLSIPEKRKQLEQYNWINTTIEYSFNSAGYRSVEFNPTDDGFIVLGCSFTSGIGLHVNQIWPELLSNKLNQSVWNLGVGGCGLDTAYRLAEHYIPRLKPSKVVLLAPEWTRIELWDKPDFPRTLNHSFFGSSDPLLTNLYMKTWIANHPNVHYRGIKNIHSIAYICQTLDIEFYCYDVNKDFMTIQGQTGCLGRDLMHNGPKCHEVFADIVYNDIKNNKVFSPEWVKLDVDC